MFSVIEQRSLQDESTSSTAALHQNVDTLEDNNTYSQVSMENNDSVITGDQTVVSDLPPPLPLQMERLTKEEGKRVISSYENVYEGVELDPQINRLSLDASELDIGDRFDTKQKETHLQTTELASSYEQLYENGQSAKDVGELSPLTTGAFVQEVSSSSKALSVSNVNFTSSASKSHACQVYITVEEGLDKLACDQDGSGGDIFSSHHSHVKADFKERSHSYEMNLEPVEDVRIRHNSSPDMSGMNTQQQASSSKSTVVGKGITFAANASG